MESPTVRRRQFGIELRNLRKRANISPAEAAEYIGITPPTLNKIENGRQPIRLAALKLMLQLYRVEAPLSDNLIRQSKEASQRGWWVAYGDVVPDWFKDYVGLEGGSTEIRAYEAGLVNGLLQTPAYTQAITLATQPTVNADELERSARFRAERQARLADNSPPTLQVVLDEAALRRPVGGPKVMREQIEHIAELSELPHVDVRLLPFSVGEHPSMGVSFTVLRWSEASADVVYVENDRGSLYLERPSDIARYVEIFEQLRSRALADTKLRSALATLASAL